MAAKLRPAFVRASACSRARSSRPRSCCFDSSSARCVATVGSAIVGPVGAVDGREHRLQAVVVFLRDRVELVVVALGAVDRQAHERADGVGDQVVAVEVAGDLAVDLGFRQLGVADEVPRAGGEEAERLDAVRRAGEEHVAGDLLLHEPRVRLVGVEGADDVIAVGPGVGPRLVLVVAVRLAEVDDIEPVPRPALAVVRARRAVDRPASRKRPGELSATKASTSSGVGGRPIRSKYSRRISVRRSASGDGDSPLSLSFARMKRSISFRIS